MINRNLLLIGLFICHLNFIFGQVCGTPHPENPTIYPQRSLSNQQRALDRSTSIPLCVDVFFHIVRNSDGSNAFTLPNTDEIVRELNQFYSPHNIIINNSGIEFINNFNYVNIDDATEARNLGQVSNRRNAINYYIVETLWNTDNGFVTGTANSIPSNNLVIRNDRILTSTSSHELGHCINLLHTHETARGVEALNGSNCASAGDLVCDTPADPRLGTNNVNRNCQYFGGNGFNPLTNNIMSYSRANCRNEFTTWQGIRMRYALENEGILQSSTCALRPALKGPSDISYGAAATYTLLNVDADEEIIWNSSSNIDIVEDDSNSQIIVESAFNLNQSGWISATLENGATITLNVYIISTDIFDCDYISSGRLKSNGYISLFGQNWLSISLDSVSEPNGWEWTAPNSYMMQSDSRNVLIRPQSSGTFIVKVRSCDAYGCGAWLSASFNAQTGALIQHHQSAQSASLLQLASCIARNPIEVSSGRPSYNLYYIVRQMDASTFSRLRSFYSGILRYNGRLLTDSQIINAVGNVEWEEDMYDIIAAFEVWLEQEIEKEAIKIFSNNPHFIDERL